VGLLYGIRAFLFVGFTEAMSYPLAMADRLVNAAALVTMLFFAGALLERAGANPDGTPYFVYGMTGLAMVGLFEAALTTFKFRLRHYQLNGMLEACAMTRTPFWQLLVATPSYDLARALLHALGLVAVAHAVAGVVPPVAGAVGAVAVVALGAVAFVAAGLLSASAVLVLKHGEPVTRLVSLVSMLFSGAFYPRDVLPPWLAAIGSWVPIAPCLDAARALLAGQPWSVAMPAVVQLAATIAVLVPITAWVFRASVARVLRDGTMGHY